MQLNRLVSRRPDWRNEEPSLEILQIISSPCWAGAKVDITKPYRTWPALCELCGLYGVDRCLLHDFRLATQGNRYWSVRIESVEFLRRQEELESYVRIADKIEAKAHNDDVIVISSDEEAEEMVQNPPKQKKRRIQIQRPSYVDEMMNKYYNISNNKECEEILQIDEKHEQILQIDENHKNELQIGNRSLSQTWTHKCPKRL